MDLDAFKALLEQAKERLTILQAWERLGLAGQPRMGVQKSPLRSDLHGQSFSIFSAGKAFKDHADASHQGDVVNFVELALGCDRKQACRRVIELAGLGQWHAEEGAPAAAPEVRAARTERCGWQARRLPELPRLISATEDRLQRLGELRGLPTAGLRWACELGLLGFAYVGWAGGGGKTKAELRGVDAAAKGAMECWMVYDDSRCCAQFRRLDGLPLTKGGAKGLPPTRSWGNWPIGAMSGAEAGLTLLMVEGAPDLLAAACLIHEEGLTERMRPCALLGASQSIHPGARAFLRGRTVLVCEQRDEAKRRPDGSVYFPGQEAAARWMQLCREHGAEARRIRLPDAMPGKDLNDFMKWAGRRRGVLTGILRHSADDSRIQLGTAVNKKKLE